MRHLAKRRNFGASRIRTLILVAAVCALATAWAAPVAPASNRAMSWGYGLWGRLGNGVTRQVEHKVGNVARPSPVCATGTVGTCPVGPYLNEVDALSAGGAHSLALLSDGKVVAWGENKFGQLGDATHTGPGACVSANGVHEEFEETRPCSATPVAVNGLTGVSAIAAGGAHSLALLTSGTVVAWGANAHGQLGNGTTENSDTPAGVSGLTGVVAIAAGGDDSLALLSNGTVMAWGANNFGQLGDGTTIDRHAPVAVSGLSGASAISTSGEHSLARLTNGTVMAWGANNEGQLGNGSTEASTLPIAVGSLSGVAGVSAGANLSLGLLSSRALMSWGVDSGGQLGIGGAEVERLAFSDVPVEVCAVGVGPRGLCRSGPFLSGVSTMSAGSTHSLALLETGAVVSWGVGCDGELGNGTGTQGGEVCITPNDFAFIPVEVSGLSNVNGVSAGNAYSLAFGPVAPAVTGLSPTQGLEAGGTSVSVTGTNFTEASAVHFGVTAAASFTLNSATSITAVSPPGTGTVDVTVTTPEGTSSIGAADRFHYAPLPPPVVGRVTPTFGPVEGGTIVTITNAVQSFIEVTSVKFGAVEAASFTVNSANSITAVSPPEPAGLVNITVTNPGGTSALTNKDHFKFLPTITKLSPSTGATAGGTSVTMTGTGFGLGKSATKVKFGTVKAISVNCGSSTSCTVVAPAHAAGTVDVKATVNKVSSAKTAADQFTYN